MPRVSCLASPYVDSCPICLGSNRFDTWLQLHGLSLCSHLHVLPLPRRLPRVSRNAMPQCILCKKRYRPGAPVNLFCFPRDKKQRSVWLARVRLMERDVFPWSRICSDHFDRESFDEVPPIRMELLGNPRYPRKLKACAVPNIWSPTKKVKERSTGKWRKDRDESFVSSPTLLGHFFFLAYNNL
jgi:hypothetical protein